MAWSGFWESASGPEASRCASLIGPGSGRTQPTRYQFPTFRIGTDVHLQTARIILRKTRLDPIWLWRTVSDLGQTYPVRKQAGVQESSGLFRVCVYIYSPVLISSYLLPCSYMCKGSMKISFLCPIFLFNSALETLRVWPEEKKKKKPAPKYFNFVLFH